MKGGPYDYGSPFLYMVLCIPFVWAFVHAVMRACVRFCVNSFMRAFIHGV